MRTPGPPASASSPAPRFALLSLLIWALPMLLPWPCRAELDRTRERLEALQPAGSMGGYSQGFTRDQLDETLRAILDRVRESGAAHPAADSKSTPTTTTFRYAGTFEDIDHPAGPPSLWNWIEGNWEVTIEAQLEMSTTTSPDQWAKIYSIKSVTFLIPLQYRCFKKTSTPPPTEYIHESYLAGLGTSNFNLSFNLQGLSNNTYDYSFVMEWKGLPNPGDYAFMIFLKYDEKKTFVTPNGSALKLGGGLSALEGGFSLNHVSYAPPPGVPGFWPLGSSFLVPPGYYDVTKGTLSDWCLVFETEYAYTDVRFWDADQPDRLVAGAVADGASQVTVEVLDVNTSANVAIAEGDGTWVSSPTLQNGVWRRVWQAPEDFGGASDPDCPGRRTIIFQVTVDGQNREAPFYLYKAPVVLLHGIWATADDTWPSLQHYLLSSGFPFVQAPSYDNNAYFADNSLVPQQGVENALIQARLTRRLVAKKADIVAASMGGVLTKLFGSEDYIRRIITVGTPHFGSPLADLVVAKILPNQWLTETLSRLIEHPLNCGAVYDLRTTTCNAPGDRIKVPVLAINGVANSNEYPAAEKGAGLVTLLQPFLLTFSPAGVHNALFPGDTSDWVVSGTSQKGGLPAANTRDINVDWHVPEPLDLEFMEMAHDFLEAPAATLAPSAPVPAVQPQIVPAPAAAFPRYQAAPETAATMSITQPAPGTNFAPGDNVQISVSPPAGATRVLIMLSGGPFAVVESAPFTATLEIPRESLGEVVIGALASDASGVVGSAYISVNAATAATLTGLKVWPESAVYLVPNQTQQLSVTGKFSDGYDRKVTLGRFGTSYTSANAGVASVSGDGLIKALGPGYTLVTGSNGSLSQQIPVLVSGPAVDAPDLAASWLYVSQTCSGSKTKKCKLSGKLHVVNQGTVAAAASTAKFHLSDDAFFDASDTYLNKAKVAALKPSLAKDVSLKATLPPGANASGKYVIAVLDGDNQVAERSEGNNIIVYGPLP